MTQGETQDSLHWKAIAARCVNAIKGVQLFLEGRRTQEEAVATLMRVTSDIPKADEWLLMRDQLMKQEGAREALAGLILAKRALRRISKGEANAAQIAKKALSEIDQEAARAS